MKEKVSILVIDDEKGICDFFKKVLTKEGYKVLTALNGQKGLAITERERPDMVLLDLKMPGLDGIEVLRRIKKIDRNIVIIILTAYGTMETARMAMKLGAFDYLTKPFDLEYVKAVLKDGLKSTLAGVAAEIKRSKAVREAAQQKARLNEISHCHKDHPCLWEVAIKTFLLGDDSFALKWTENPKVPKDQKRDLMKLVHLLRSDLSRGR